MEDKKMPGTQSNGAVTETARIDFIVTLRALAVLLVLWDHLVGHWLKRKHLSWWPHSVVHEYVNVPLGIIQDFGWLGVCLFFLISGYVITHVAQRETGRQFTVRRLLRIYPPLIVAVPLAMLCGPLSGEPVAKNLQELLWGMTLLNYMKAPQHTALGVGWTLVIEVLFYALVAVQSLWFRRLPRTAVFFNLAACVAVLAYSRQFGDNFFLLAASVAYIPYLVLGQIFYLRSRGIAGNGFLALATVAAFGVAQYGIRDIHTAFLPLGNSYLLSFAIAVGVFVMAMLVNLKPPRGFAFVARISYSLYLVHGAIGFTFLGAFLYWGVPYPVSLCVALAAVFGAAWAMHRLVERPSQELGRKWTMPKVPTPKLTTASPEKAPVATP